MPITFHPKPGQVLICDFDTGFRPPEMVKQRPVIVISPRRRSNLLCTVVPLSTTAPNPVEPCHHLLDSASLPSKLSNNPTWAKCDMVATVGLTRLDRVKNGKDARGKRLYVVHEVTAGDLDAVRKGVMHALGIALEVEIDSATLVAHTHSVPVKSGL